MRAHGLSHKGRIKTEGKEKFLVSVWRTEFIQFLAGQLLCTSRI